MDFTTVLGLVAGALTTVSLVPQVAQIWKTRSAKDVSLGMFVVFCIGVAMWLTYGILQSDVPIVVWNSITLVLSLAVVVMKLKYG
jgi:MtN3 and saliva related transmembrane protein